MLDKISINDKSSITKQFNHDVINHPKVPFVVCQDNSFNFFYRGGVRDLLWRKPKVFRELVKFFVLSSPESLRNLSQVEIADYLGFGRQRVNVCLLELIRLGFLTYTDNGYRLNIKKNPHSYAIDNSWRLSEAIKELSYYFNVTLAPKVKRKYTKKVSSILTKKRQFNIKVVTPRGTVVLKWTILRPTGLGWRGGAATSVALPRPLSLQTKAVESFSARATVPEPGATKKLVVLDIHSCINQPFTLKNQAALIRSQARPDGRVLRARDGRASFLIRDPDPDPWEGSKGKRSKKNFPCTPTVGRGESGPAPPLASLIKRWW